MSAQSSRFSLEERECLREHYRLTNTPSSDRRLSLAASDLLDAETCRTYLMATPLWKEKELPAVASQFAKRYGFLTMSAALYAMTMYDKGLNCALDRCSVESVYREDAWLPELRLVDEEVTVPGSEGRDAWREAVIRGIFAENIAIVWQAMAGAARMPVSILWENLAASFYWLYETKMPEEAADPKQRMQIEEDFRFLLEAPTEWFGLHENPLRMYDSPKIIPTGDGIMKRKRKTCCLLYRVSASGAYCKTCPLLKA
ncbi:IucA/IucC family C-terminal-domain containing protein [Gorillibacterium sp. CAU 1737]|uniref:IucA/IucC family C-terminal-domain containing protein n=1 Tax=Gorillibacterium sp. CAU 1737 TaxID=3140362 RepID=UPI0032617D76